MNGHEQEIASALREMAGRAATPPPKVGAAWRAGRRRRRNVMTASVAGAAGVTAAAVLVPMAVIGGTASPGLGAAQPGGPTSPPISMVNPVVPHPKVQLSRVSNVAEKPCPRGSHGVPSRSGRTCYYLTGKTITVTLESVEVVQEAGATTMQGKPVYTIKITLARSDAATMQALTAHLMNLSPPADEVAWIVNGKVVTSPGIPAEVSTTSLLGAGSLHAEETLAAEVVGMGPPIFVTGPVPTSSG